MNFNIVKKNKKKDDDEDLLDEDELEVEEEKSSSNNNDAKKKMFKFMGFVLIGVFLIFFLLYLVSLFSRGHSYTYEDIEKVLVDAAKEYFAENPSYLPTEDGNVVEVDHTNLVAAGKMKDLSEYLEEGVSCSASVLVEKSGSEYLYSPFLNCGDTYATVLFHDKVVSDQSVVSSGYGLYSMNGGYVFRGELVNNYVQLSNSVWRIVKITSNNNVVLISEDGAPYSQPWDNRYNEDRFYESGINQYSASRVREYLEKIYSNPSTNDGEDLLSEGDRARIVSYNVCTGKRTTSSESKNNSEECAEVLQNQKLGLLTLSDYMVASIDTSCKSSKTKSCQNYNYLAKDFDWWLVTANKEDNSTVFKVDRGGVITTDNASTYSIVRPVIYLNSNVLYDSGDGSLENPYVIR